MLTWMKFGIYTAADAAERFVLSWNTSDFANDAEEFERRDVTFTQTQRLDECNSTRWTFAVAV